jgi:hypothetical protein
LGSLAQVLIGYRLVSLIGSAIQPIACCWRQAAITVFGVTAYIYMYGKVGITASTRAHTHGSGLNYGGHQLRSYCGLIRYPATS